MEQVSPKPALAARSLPTPRTRGEPIVSLALGALGVVFGDIGTSPLYTLRECMHAVGGERASTTDLFGILSLIFWSLTMVVTVKYLAFVMRAANHGEGGIFALLAILPENMRTHPSRTLPPAAAGEGARTSHVARRSPARLTWVAVMVVIGASLLYGDGAITPAISVLAAIEGLAMADPDFGPLIVPITCAILVGLFAIQRRGTGAVGQMFGPIMLVWFAVIGTLGVAQIIQRPQVLVALSPVYAVQHFATHGWHGFLVLGSVVLAVTGGEALYADMGHFGVRPIRFVWLGFAMPALVLCYFGQGALLLREPHALANPFFGMVPPGGYTLAMVVLSSMATVIASQALISGAFSLTRQAMQLGYFPRVTIKHTAHHMEGQIYIPQINWLLAVACLLLVLGFQRSDRLAAAYGIAVTGTMTITSVVFYVVSRQSFGWPRWKALPLLVLFLAFDLPFFIANTFKIRDGGWVPVMIGMVFVASMLVWSRGRTLVIEQYAERFPSFDDALPVLRAHLSGRTPGVAVFMASSTTHVPPILMHFVERIRVLPETVILLTVITESTPAVPYDQRSELTALGEGVYRLIVRYGFMEHPKVPQVVGDSCARHKLHIDLRDATYYLGRDSLLATRAGKMGSVAESFFAYLARNAVAADRHFGIPPRQVVEIGLQIDL
ncbi:MAG TPA: potassium uptake protein [Polyangiales bacterium]|nr:potassium uptake protein [Polyangiales bacterium]